MEKSKILIISPHQDDDVIGCGGFIAKYSPKNQFSTLFFYECQSKKESKESSGGLGVKKHYFFDEASRTILKKTNAIQSLKKTLIRISPTIILVPNPDRDRDHRECFDVTMEAIFLSELEGRISPSAIMGYSIWSEIDRPELYIDITKYLAHKIEAIKKQQSQLKEFDYVSLINSRAKTYGLLSGYEMAEAYKIYFLKEGFLF